jgi:poly(hydroxyalkanoate) depolymerase family esterase
VLGETRAFLTVYPEQSTAANASRCWNWFQASNQERDKGEPALIAGITREVMAKYSVDPQRVYLTGLSAGAAQAVLMAALYPDLYAAFAAHAGCQFKGFPCSDFLPPSPLAQGDLAFAAMGAYRRVVPLIVFQGTADTVVVPSNAGRIISQWARTNDRAANDVLDGDIDDVPELTETGQVPAGRSYTRTAYRNATDGQTVMEKYLVSGMPHAYSGGSASEQFTDPAGPDATALSYDFFLAHPRP